MMNISKQNSRRLQSVQAILNGNCQIMQGNTMTNLNLQNSLDQMGHILPIKGSSS